MSLAEALDYEIRSIVREEIQLALAELAPREDAWLKAEQVAEYLGFRGG